MPFRQWLTCPECGGEDTGVLAYPVAIVFECYGCGHTDEFEFSEEIPVQELDGNAIESMTDESND